MSFHTMRVACLLLIAAFNAVHAAAAENIPRYDLGAVADVRQASEKGVLLLAVTPGGAADRMGLRPGDRLLSINGRRLDTRSAPRNALDDALQEGDGQLKVEAVRAGRRHELTGRADARTVLAQTPAGRPLCGYVSDQGVAPKQKGIFNADITQIDGRSTSLRPENRHRVDAGKRVLVVRELIDPARLNSAQLLQIQKMKKFAMARAYKSVVVDVSAGNSYRIGARLLRDKLDTQAIRDNAYWEPVVWQVIEEACP